MLTMSVMCVIWKEGETERKKEIRRKEQRPQLSFTCKEIDYNKVSVRMEVYR